MSKDAHYQYYHFEGITHRLISNFHTSQPELLLLSYSHDMTSNSNTITFTKQGSSLTSLFIEHDEPNKALILYDQEDKREMLYFSYVSYFKYDPTHLTVS